MSRTKWERFQVLIMGPVMNIVLAVVVMTLVLYQGAEIPAYEEEAPVVGTVVEGSEAESVGIEVGERIVSVEGRPTDTWGDLLASRSCLGPIERFRSRCLTQRGACERSG